MKILYANKKTEKQCTSIKAADKQFGGDKQLTRSLMARINAIQQAMVIKDIIQMPSFRFHKLSGNWEGFFAIDVKSIRDKWRVILQPLDENEEPFDPCNIDQIASSVTIVEINEVSAHYE